MTEYAKTHEIQWKSVTEELPSVEGLYLVYAESADEDCPLMITIWWFLASKRWDLVKHWNEAISHWALMPAPPEKVNAGTSSGTG